MITNVRLISMALLLASAAVPVLWSHQPAPGPMDQSTWYYVNLGVTNPGNASQQYDCGKVKLDCGGVTSLSAADAQAAGLLKADGTNAVPHSGTVNLNGTGGGKVKCYKFDNVTISVTPLTDGGQNNGTPQTVTVTVVVPVPEGEQPGATPRERSRQRRSVKTKAGKNVAGATFGGNKKLDLVDEATNDPRKNKRSTRWVQASFTAGDPSVTILGGGFDGHGFYFPPTMPRAAVGSLVTEVAITGHPLTMIPMAWLEAANVRLTGSMALDLETQADLFVEGHLENLGEHDLVVESGVVSITLFTTAGTFHTVEVAIIVHPEPEAHRIVLGINAIVPEQYAAVLEPDADALFLAPLER